MACSKSIPQRFWEKVSVSGPDDCWPWIASVQTGGYGSFSIYDHSRTAHQVAWEFANGPIPEGLCVLHRCDNPPCVNHAHLFLGTFQENVADRHAKGRDAAGDRNGSRTRPDRLRHGSAHWKTKLHERDILAIRASAFGSSALARIYGVDRSTIKRIRRRRFWRHVE